MGRAIDATGIQFKLLNRSRGPAVWSPRAQADKRVYGQWVRGRSRGGAEPVLDHREGRTDPDRRQPVVGLELEDGTAYRCDSLIVTTGTFLNGLVHIGPEQRPAGRAGEPPSHALAESLKSFGFTWGRLKTGTPPRLSRASIDFSRFAAGARRRAGGALLVSDGSHRARPDCLSGALHHRQGPRSRARSHRALAAVQRSDSRYRSPVLPVARGQGDAVSASRAPPDFPRARRPRRRRNLRERLLHEPSRGRSSCSWSVRCPGSRTP